MNDDWNVISQTIIPHVPQKDFTTDVSQSGMSEIVQSFFFSPKLQTARGLIWGAGPVIQFPTAKNNSFGVNEWGLGLTAVGLKQTGSWIFAVNPESQYNHIDEEWAVPINLRISKATKIGNQPVSLLGRLRYWADSPAGGADGWGVTLGITLLHPK